MKIGSPVWYTALITSAFLSMLSSQAQPVDAGAPGLVPHRVNPSFYAGVLPGGTAAVKNILYHNGPVMVEPNVYVIWYGNWNQANGTDNAAGQQIVRDFLNAVGGSPYFAINTTYSSSTAVVSGAVTFAGETSDAGSQGLKLSDAGVQAVVNRAITNSALPKDANGVYFVLTSSDVTETSGFCRSYCGWHTHATLSSADIKYSFVGNSAKCLSACAAQTNSPNANPGVDGMVSVVAHELEETTTDPDLNAWYDRQGQENADKCAWTFGQHQYHAANGAWANMGWDYLDATTGAVLYHRDY
ncbi:MAG: hypothetical protein ACXWKG_19245, partial [Limisphaerales bacterium]